MPKVQRKNKPKGRAANAARTARGRSRGTDSNVRDTPSDLHHDQIVGLTDPFSSEAGRAQYPDSGAGKTLTFQQRFSVPFTTDANGTYALAFTPKSNYTLTQMSSAVGSVVTWAAASSGNSNASTNLLMTYGELFRPTSMGVRVCNTLSATNCSGYVVLAKGGPAPLNSATTFSPSNFTSWDSHPMIQGGEWHVVSCPRSATSYEMLAVADYGVDYLSGMANWETIYVLVKGAPATTSAILVDWVVNYEYTVRDDAPIAQLAVPQPVMSIPIQTAVNSVQSNMATSHRANTAAFSNILRREAKKALVKHVIPFAAKKATQLLL